MLDNTGTRQLAYVVTIDNITPIEGYDRVELAHIMGWTVVVGKGEFNIGDPAIYFEIDSQLSEVEPFTNMSFLAKKHFKIKTQKMCGGNFSQGLLMSATNFGWNICGTGNGGDSVVHKGIIESDGTVHLVDDESKFLTKRLGVTYAEPADNKRKAPTVDKYKAMAQRHPKLFSKASIRWLMRRKWGKKLMFFFFGKKKDKKSDWPYWVKKTDEERVENMPWLFNSDSKETWIATEKIDGTSTTFTMRRRKWPLKNEFYICSRNVVLNDPNKPCFYDSNVYAEMAEKYHIKEKMESFLNTAFKNCEWITIQGETYGAEIQKRDYSINEHNFMAFNFITSKDGRWNSSKMKVFLEHDFGIPCVPILDENYILPSSIEELRTYVDSDTSVIDGKMREGIVFRSQDGLKSFKCVSPNYLLTYHQ